MAAIRFFPLLFALMLIFTGCSDASTPTGVDEAFAAGAEYYHAHMESWEEALAATAAGKPVSPEDCEALVVISDQAIPTGTLAGYVCMLTASGADAKLFAGSNLVGMLEMRQQDGAFGFLYDTILSALALEGAGETYDVDGLLRYLIVCQRADGSFDDQSTTGLALSLLSTIDDERAKTMAGRAGEYLSAAEISDAALPYAVIGLADTGKDTDDLVERLIGLQGEDGRFPTPMFLVALSAVKDGASVFVRYASDTAMVLIQILHDGVTVETGRIEADADSDALTLTKRFCAKQGIDIVVVQGQVRQIGEYTGNWALAEGSSTAAGGSITWSN